MWKSTPLPLPCLADKLRGVGSVSEECLNDALGAYRLRALDEDGIARLNIAYERMCGLYRVVVGEGTACARNSGTLGKCSGADTYRYHYVCRVRRDSTDALMLSDRVATELEHISCDGCKREADRIARGERC